MEEKKKFKLGLLPKLIIAIIVGILFGQFLPEGFCRFVVTLSSFFSQFLSFIIPLMILAYVTMGIANLKSGGRTAPSGTGKPHQPVFFAGGNAPGGRAGHPCRAGAGGRVPRGGAAAR